MTYVYGSSYRYALTECRDGEEKNKIKSEAVSRGLVETILSAGFKWLVMNEFPVAGLFSILKA